MKYARHGDVILKKVESLPKEVKEIFNGKTYTVALGEATGHSHVMTAKSGLRVFQGKNGVRYLDLTGKARIRHQEHRTLEIEPGVYKIDQEKEYSYFDEEIKKVVD